MLAGVCAAGAMSPGPSLLVVVRTALASGMAAGLIMSVAHGLAVALYAGAILFGLDRLAQASLLTDWHWLLLALRYAGAAFLLYLAWHAATVAWRGIATAPSATAVVAASAPPPPVSSVTAARDGFLTGLLNPKIALWFTALFSQFVGQANHWEEKLGILVLAAGIDIVWYAAVVWVVTGWSNTNAQSGWQQRLAIPANLLFALLLSLLALRVVVGGGE